MKLAIAKLRSKLNAHHLSVLAWVGVLIGIAVFGGGWKAGLMTGVPILYLARHASALRRKHDRETASLHLRMIEALAIMVEAKDETTHQHIWRVAFYARELAREMGINGSDLQALHAAALLHDIGKVAVPGHIISKPGRLTEEEFERMKIHPAVGAEILEKLQLPYPVVPIVRSHHERWNGAGYPDGLKGEGIPRGARVLAVVDAFDALTTDRPYRAACSPQQAMEELKQGAGVIYDPNIVRLLDELYPRWKELLESSQSTQPSSAIQARRKDRAEPQTGLSVELASPLYSVVQARQELQIVYELAQGLGSTLTTESIFRLLADHIQKLIPYNTIGIYVVDGGDLVARFVEGLHDYTLARRRLPIGKGLSGWVAGNEKHILNGNPSVEQNGGAGVGDVGRLRSALSVPLNASDAVVGVLTLYSARYEAFSVDNLRVLKTIAAKAGPCLHNALTYEQAGKSADTDPLTGLPNAKALASHLEQETTRAIRENAAYSLFVMDLNGLKEINDTLGHLVGNQVIRAVADGLRSRMRPYDFLARIGGDEFLLLLPRASTQDAVDRRIDLAVAIRNLGSDFPNTEVSISIGSATFPVDSRDPQDLIAIADRRMYQYKREHHRRRVTEPASPVLAAVG